MKSKSTEKPTVASFVNMLSLRNEVIEAEVVDLFERVCQLGELPRASAVGLLNAMIGLYSVSHNYNGAQGPVNGQGIELTTIQEVAKAFCEGWVGSKQGLAKRLARFAQNGSGGQT